ncbi:MAG: hypothetical protein R3D57_16985 [Hyphomicrobiaceae bacterium]
MSKALCYSASVLALCVGFGILNQEQARASMSVAPESASAHESRSGAIVVADQSGSDDVISLVGISNSNGSDDGAGHDANDDHSGRKGHGSDDHAGDDHGSDSRSEDHSGKSGSDSKGESHGSEGHSGEGHGGKGHGDGHD